MIHALSRLRRSGTAAVEFALVLPLFLSLLLGAWEVGRMIEVQQILNNAARDGARQAASGNWTVSQVQTNIVNYLKAAGLPDYSSKIATTVSVKDLTNPTPAAPALSTDDPLQKATYLDQLAVSITIPFTDVEWLSNYLLPNSSSIKLNGYALFYTTNDKALSQTGGAPAP